MSTHTDTNVNNLIINKMTKSIYDSLDSIPDTELYFITDDDIYAKVNNLKTINGQSLIGTGDLTISGGANIDDDNVSTLTTYSSNKINTIYAKKTEIPSLTGYAKTEYVDRRVSELVNSAPETLDTLKELSDALGGDANFATTVATQIGNKQDKLTAGTGITITGNIISSTNDVDLSNYYTKSEINTSLSKKQNTLVSGTNIKTINGSSILGSGDITISGGADINDTTVSESSTYSSSKIDTTYLKAPEGRLNLTNGRITLNNDINSAYLINNEEKLVTLNGDGLSYQDKSKNITVNITPYYGGSDQTIDPAGLKVNGVTLAPETALLKKVSKSGDNMTGALTVPSITVDATTPATGTTSLKDGCINFKYKNSDDAAWNAWLEITPAGTLQFGSQGGIASEIGTVATQEWINKKLSNTYKFKGSVNTYDDLPGAAESGDVYNVKSNGANYAWTGTEWDELGATINLDNYALKTDIPSLEGYATQTWVESKGYLTEHQSLAGKQDVLVSGTNIKTINGTSILGSGDITISGGSSESSIDDTTISTSSTYSSSKIDTVYAKKTEIPSLDGYTTESRVNELIAAYMTANYESGDTKEY